MMRLLHLADVHLGASFSAFGDEGPARRTAVLDAFRRLPDFAKDASADAVLIAGDLFDGPAPAREMVAAVHETLRRLVDSGRPVFVVPGNHDAITLRPNPYTDPLGGAHVFTAPSFEAPRTAETESGPLHVYGLAYDPARAPAPLSKFRRTEAPGVHVALVHGSVKDAPHWTTSANSLRLMPDALAELDADYVALGDYHNFRSPEKFEPAGTACYSGSFAATDLTETGRRGYVIVDLEPGTSPRVEHRSSGVAHVEKLDSFDVGAFDSDAAVAEAIAKRVAAESIPVVRLVGSPEFALDAAAVRAHLTERFAHVELEDDSRYFASARLDELARRDTVTGHVVRLGRRRIEEAGDDGDREAADRALRLALGALEVR